MDAVSAHEPTRIELQDDEMHNPRFLRHRHPALRDHCAASPKRPPRPISLRPRCRCPIYGVRASAGRRARMEDAVSIVENLIEVSRPNSFWKSDRMKCDLISSNGSHSERNSGEMCETEVCHFFGVYDGHNGPYAAHHCRGRLHENLRSAYLDLSSAWDSDTESVAVAVDLGVTASEASSRDSSSSSLSSGFSLNGPMTKSRSSLTLTEEDLFLETFRRTDSQFSEYRCAERVGTTALAALVGSRHIAVGGCGDSRAVMYRKGQPIQLSNDHRLDKIEEKERIESSGGTVTYWNGPRVMGVLAMSRAIGDLCFRPYGVICDPDVSTMTRSLDDEYLLLATDGLWDVLTNEEAYRIIRHTVASNQAQGVDIAECIQSSANRLTRIALDRGSRDNITVVLLDLQSDGAHDVQRGL